MGERDSLCTYLQSEDAPGVGEAFFEPAEPSAQGHGSVTAEAVKLAESGASDQGAIRAMDTLDPTLDSGGSNASRTAQPTELVEDEVHLGLVESLFSAH
jgi:hypothetical protein